ncbi:MAG: heterodisulfide reductase subunit B [Desulforudis sp.]|jgi:heterodisulfide reductase subunit B|nr:MAG: heterodisulfide reductase subunit B [Desulforudis sp.]
MRYAYYPGCSLHATAREYDQSTREVCGALGIELVEIPDWGCCGATSAHSTSHLLSVALPARNLALAGSMGLDITVPCAACYQRLRYAQIELEQNEAVREKVARVTGTAYDSKVDVKSLLEVVVGLAPETLKSKIVRPLDALKAVCYYGCLLVRPPRVTGFDDPEDPQIMDNLLRTCGAGVLDWGYKTECCGASMGISNEEVTLKLVRDILRVAEKAGADCLVTACPLCQNNLDSRQTHVNRAFGASFEIPVLYFTQLIGLALGIEPGRLGFNSHFVPTDKILKLIT